VWKTTLRGPRRGVRVGGHARSISPLGGAAPMPDMTAEDLKQHLKLLASASTEDLDELLHDLLVKVYPTKTTQDS
jgi:hypothetical protein